MSNGSGLVIQGITATPSPKPGASRTRLLLEGPIVRTLLQLAAPNIVVNVILIAVTATIDAHFVGQLGSSALAGISLVFPLIMLMQQMANSSMGGAIASAIARAIGAGRHADASALVIHGMVIAVAMSVLFTLVLMIGGPGIYTMMGGDNDILASALEYSNAIFAGALAYWLLSTLTSVVRGAGQAAVLAVVYLAAEALHIALVPTLMFGIGPLPPLGITGAGVATVASFTASSAILAWYIISGRTPIRLSFHELRFDRRLFVEILRVGAPMSLQPILNNLALATLTGFVAALGAAQLAGFGAAVRLEYLLYPLAFGLGAGVIAMVGTNIGAGNLARAERIAWTGATVAASITGCIGLYGATFPDTWISLFTNVTEVHRLGASYLVISCFAYPFLGLGLTLASAFQAAGRPVWPVLGITSRAMVVAIGGSIAINLTEAGLAGLAVVAASGLVVYGTSLAVAFRAGVWKSPLTPASGKSSKSAANENRSAPLRNDHVVLWAIDGLLVLYAVLLRWRSRRQTFRALADLDEERLQDIGLTRGNHRSYRALAELDDTQLCHLSEHGLQVRRKVRQKASRI